MSLKCHSKGLRGGGEGAERNATSPPATVTTVPPAGRGAKLQVEEGQVPRGVLVELDGHLSQHINMLSVGKDNRVGCIHRIIE